MSGNTSARNGSVNMHAHSPLESLGDSVSKAIDPYGVTTSLLNAQMAWLLHPQELARALNSLSADLIALQSHVMNRAVGIASPDVIKPNADDARFADPIWTDSATWDIIKEWYLAFTHHLEDMLFETPGLSDKERRRSAFWLRNWLNMVAPTNFFWFNPAAMRRFVETNGDSLKQGWENLQRDIKAKNILMVEPDAFTVGKDLATTPGKVVFRNRLIELIQYAPATGAVHPVPILIVPAWIMKYYILDLSPENSLIGWLVGQGFTVFCISWKNPDAGDRDLGFDAYRELGVMAALDAACTISGAPKVHGLGYCLGGTLLAVTAAAMARDGDGRLASLSMLAAQVDFSEAGELSLFTTAPQVALLDDMMWEAGYLDQKRMAGAFNMLRSQDLIWSRMAREYLLGERDHDSDLGAWSRDATRMPYRMHSEYLRRLFLGNDLASGRFEAGGEPVFLADIRVPVFAVATEADHIAPWHSVYKLTHLLHGEATFALASGGHNSGIISAPGNPRAQFRLMQHHSGSAHESPDDWAAEVAPQQGSWWPAWCNWLRALAPGEVPPPPMGHPEAGYAVLKAAPGSYVLMP